MKLSGYSGDDDSSVTMKARGDGSSNVNENAEANDGSNSLARQNSEVGILFERHVEFDDDDLVNNGNNLLDYEQHGIDCIETLTKK